VCALVGARGQALVVRQFEIRCAESVKQTQMSEVETEPDALRPWPEQPLLAKCSHQPNRKIEKTWSDRRACY
jgi:hypothetical protein